MFFLLPRSSKKQRFYRKPHIPLIVLKVLRVAVAQTRRVGETLIFRPLGSTSWRLRGTSVSSLRVALASDKHLFAKPIKNQCKINGFGLSWSCLGCSRGHSWEPWGPIGGAQGAPKEVFGGSICVWMRFGGLLGPPWALEKTSISLRQNRLSGQGEPSKIAVLDCSLESCVSQRACIGFYYVFSCP